MTSRNLSRSLLLGIIEKDRDILTLTEGHRQPLASAVQSPSLPHLPGVQISAQYFIDMGLTPTTAERLLFYFSKFVMRYRQNFEFYFARIIQRGCVLPPTYYHDTFVLLYKRTIQSWESQIRSSVHVWLYQTGAFSPDLRKGCLDIRVDDATKNSILSKLGFLITPLLSSKCGTSQGVVTARLEEVCEKDDGLLTKPANHYLTLPVSSAISSMATASSSGNLLSGTVPPACFPTQYPPPPGESRKTFATSFTRRASIHTEKSTLNCSDDMTPLISLFGQMGTRAQRSSKGFPRNPKSKKAEPLPPLLSPIIVDASGTSCETLPTRIGSAPTPKPTPVKRRRRIAPLPNRHKSSDSLPSSDSPSSAISGTALSSQGATSRVPSTPAIIIGETPLECADTSLSIFRPRSTPLAQDSAEVSSLSMSKSGAPRQRKAIPLPRRVPPRPQGIFSSQQAPLSTLPGTSRPVPRSPSLVLDASSSSSSDELDTPPSTPPHVSSIRSTIAESMAIPPKTNMLMSRRSPSLGDGVFPKPRERIIHIDLTRGVCGQERPLTFTFGV